jgi:hypothetical protein
MKANATPIHCVKPRRWRGGQIPPLFTHDNQLLFDSCHNIKRITDNRLLFALFSRGQVRGFDRVKASVREVQVCTNCVSVVNVIRPCPQANSLSE